MKFGLTRLHLGATAALLSAGFLVSCTSRERPPSVYSEFRPAVESLGGYDYQANYVAMHTLFAAGREAIPALVEVLDSEADIWANCGSFSLHSETIKVDFDSPIWEGHPRTVGEIALYLIESILRSNIYFAQSCGLEINGIDVTDSLKVSKRIKLVASSLKELSSSELESLAPQDLESIMKRNGLEFPQGDS